jgi:hypothetical protein
MEDDHLHEIDAVTGLDNASFANDAQKKKPHVNNRFICNNFIK